MRKILLDPEQTTREADGTVAIRETARVLGVGPGRANRLLEEAGLLRMPINT